MPKPKNDYICVNVTLHWVENNKNRISMATENVVQRVLRCKSSTDASKLAGSISCIHKDTPEVEIILRVVGAGALNQATKAAIMVNKYVAQKGEYVVFKPYFVKAEADRTAIELKVIFMR